MDNGDHYIVTMVIPKMLRCECGEEHEISPEEIQQFGIVHTGKQCKRLRRDAPLHGHGSRAGKVNASMTREEARSIHGCLRCTLADKHGQCRQCDLALGGNIDHCPVPDELHEKWKGLGAVTMRKGRTSLARAAAQA